MISVDSVTKYYGNNLGIENVSFRVKKNEIVGLLGKNGAGKSTCLNIITGYISSDEGTVKIDGYDILKEPALAKSKIGYLPEKPPVYQEMTVNEYLNFCADLKGIEKELRINHIDEICTLAGINEVRKRLCRNLSKGYTQRLGIAQALIGNPEVLILDEPTIGLDPKQIIEVRQLIKALGEKHTIIMSSHILSEAAQLCQRIIIIDKGRIAADDTFENLISDAKQNKKMLLRVKGTTDEFKAAVQQLKGIVKVDVLGEAEKGSIDLEIEYKNSSLREDIFNLAVKRNVTIIMMKPVEKNLEDVFLQVTKQKGGNE